MHAFMNMCLDMFVEEYVMYMYIKVIKNFCLCIVEIRGTRGCVLVRDPARALGECRDVAKTQSYVPLISTMHG